MLYNTLISVFKNKKCPRRYSEFLSILERFGYVDDEKAYELVYGDFTRLYNYLLNLGFEIDWTLEKQIYEKHSEDYYKWEKVLKLEEHLKENSIVVPYEDIMTSVRTLDNKSDRDDETSLGDNENFDDELYDDDFFDLDKILHSDKFKDKMTHHFNVTTYNDNPELFEEYELESRKETFDQIVEANQPLVKKIASNYHFALYNTCLTHDDLVAYGNLGLFIAIKKFDPSLENAFSTYATHWIKQSITRNIADYGYIVRIPVHLSDQISKINNLEKKHRSLYNKVDVDLICEEAELSLEKYYSIKSVEWRYRHNVSTDSIVKENSSLGDFYSTEANVLEQSVNEYTTPADETIVTEVFNGHVIQSMCDLLSEREFRVLVLRFGIEDGIQRTLESVGEIFGVTRERIRQIESKALNRLRKNLSYLEEDM